jgi:hypothetical protein
MINAYKILAENPEMKSLLGTFINRCKNNIDMNKENNV